jgi:hypothetical protein
MQGRSLFALTGITALTLATISGSANAEVVVQTVNIGPLTTNWIKNLTVNQFDANLGTLTKVELFVSGHIDSQYQIESFQSSATSHYFRLNGDLTVRRPDNTVFAQATVLNERTDDLAAFDGLLDAGGTSGLTGNIAKDMVPGAAEISDGPGVLPFIGNGTLDFPVSATMSSFFQGSSNVFRAVFTTASAEIKVVYTYNPIPTPGSVALVGAAGILGFRRRR